jgi:hypothetical protein
MGTQMNTEDTDFLELRAPQYKRKVYDNGLKGSPSWYKPQLSSKS